MNDKILEMFFDIKRWTYAIDKGAGAFFTLNNLILFHDIVFPKNGPGGFNRLPQLSGKRQGF